MDKEVYIPKLRMRLPFIGKDSRTHEYRARFQGTDQEIYVLWYYRKDEQFWQIGFANDMKGVHLAYYDMRNKPSLAETEAEFLSLISTTAGDFAAVATYAHLT
mgnify:CR=1 FL=1